MSMESVCRICLKSSQEDEFRLNDKIELEADKITKEETVTIKKETYEKLVLTDDLYNFFISDEFLKNVRTDSYYEDKPLHGASASGRLDMVQKLLEMGHNVNVTNMKGETPLHRAVINNHLSIVEYLIKKNALINTKSKGGCTTPLHDAVQNNNLTMVKYLVEKNAFLVAQDSECMTPLHIAVQRNYTKIVEYLCSLKDSCHLRCKDKQGLTPLTMARKSRFFNSCAIIIEKFVDC